MIRWGVIRSGLRKRAEMSGMVSIGLLGVVELCEALEELLRDLPQPVSLALQQLPLLYHLVA